MASGEEQQIEAVEDVDEETPNYKAPAKKAMEDMLNIDKDDEALEKWKKDLVGPSTDCAFPDDPHQVIVTRMTLVPVEDGHDGLTLDLTGDLSQLKKNVLVLKEGCHYRIRIDFYVQREIVTGLRYVQKSHRKGITVDTTKLMVGSYGPKPELQSYTSPVEEAPSGMIARAKYTVKSVFTDDDKHEHLKWEWCVEIKKDWK